MERKLGGGRKGRMSSRLYDKRRNKKKRYILMTFVIYTKYIYVIHL